MDRLSKIPYLKNIKSFLKFRVAVADFQDDSRLDIAWYRREEYPSFASLPVVSQGGREEDLQRRDFTINSLYLPIRDFIKFFEDSKSSGNFEDYSIIDDCDGIKHLRNSILEVHHNYSFLDDPTRIIRAARYGALLKATNKNEIQLGPKAIDSLAKCYEKKAVNFLTVERFSSEIKKLFSGKFPLIALAILDDFKFIDNFFRVNSSVKALALISFLNDNFEDSQKKDILAKSGVLLIWYILYTSNIEDYLSIASKFGIKRKTVKKIELIIKESSNMDDHFQKIVAL